MIYTDMWKIKLHKFISEHPIIIIMTILAFIIITPSTFISAYYFDKPLLLTFMFIGSIVFVTFMMTIQFFIRDIVVEWDFELTYKLYKYFKIEEKEKKITKKRVKDAFKKNSLSPHMNKRPTSEISPIRRILIKNLDDD